VARLFVEPNPRQILVRAIMKCHTRAVASRHSVIMIDIRVCGAAARGAVFQGEKLGVSSAHEWANTRSERSPGTGRRRQDCAMHKLSPVMLYESGMVALRRGIALKPAL
jgi:hypothetical protein